MLVADAPLTATESRETSDRLEQKIDQLTFRIDQIMDEIFTTSEQ